MFLNNVDIVEANALQCLRQYAYARTVNWRIYDLQVCTCIVLYIVAQRLESFNVGIVDICANFNHILQCVVELDVLDCDFPYILDYALVVRRNYLSAIAPVNFVSVVFFRVMRSGDDDSRVAVQVTDCKRQFGRRTQLVEQINLNSICRQYRSGNLCKFAAVVTAVVCYCATDSLSLVAECKQIVCQSLRSHSHGVAVHTVCSRPHNSAQSASAELQVLVEALVELFGVIFNHFGDSLACLLVENFACPILGFL